MMPVWAGALDEWNRMTGSINTLVCIGTGRLTGWHPSWVGLSSIVWIDANPDIQMGNLERWGDQSNLELVTTTVSVDGQLHPYWRHNFDVLDGLLPVSPTQALYPNLVVGSNAPVQTSAFNDLMANHADNDTAPSVGLVLDVNAVAGRLLDCLDARHRDRLGWLAVAVPDPQLYADNFNLAFLDQWADLHGFSVNRWISDGRSATRWWIASPNRLARTQRIEHARQLQLLSDQHERESTLTQREFRVLSRLVKTLSDQAQLAAVSREHNQTVIQELELELQQALDWIETLHSRQFVTLRASQPEASTPAPVAVARVQAAGLSSSDDQRQRIVEEELLRAQAQINLLKDVMLGRIQ